MLRFSSAPLVKVFVEDNIIIVLRDIFSEAIVFFKEADQFLGRPVICQSLWNSAFSFEKFLENFLDEGKSTLPIPLLWHDSWT